jgi:hypothetical protein
MQDLKALFQLCVASLRVNRVKLRSGVYVLPGDIPTDRILPYLLIYANTLSRATLGFDSFKYNVEINKNLLAVLFKGEVDILHSKGACGVILAALDPFNTDNEELDLIPLEDAIVRYVSDLTNDGNSEDDLVNDILTRYYQEYVINVVGHSISEEQKLVNILDNELDQSIER